MSEYEKLAEVISKFLSNIKYPFWLVMNPRRYIFYGKWTAKNKLAFRRYWKRFKRNAK